MSIAKNLHLKMAGFVIPIALVVAYFIFHNLLGNPANFEGGVVANQPLKGNYLGIIHKGGPIVILLITFQIVLVTFVIERFISIRLALGKNEPKQLIDKVKEALHNNDFKLVQEQCNAHKGSLANVLEQGVVSYQKIHLKFDAQLKARLLQNELENYAQLELPYLQKNMVILSTIAQVATLVGLLGTVTGMIVAFSAMARVGAPDAVGLATGISQALVTTALGISTSAVAIVFFNYFTSSIEKIVSNIDDAIFSLVQTVQIKD
ncbi:MAG: MotA/TolQ/ExbB proton channel family protein [Luteibaculaceae bacterium]